jgi:cysteine synthase A
VDIDAVITAGSLDRIGCGSTGQPDDCAGTLPVVFDEERGRHGIQGLADGFIPDIVNMDEIDEVIRIETSHAIERARQLAREEGLLVGISSGANVIAAAQLATERGPGKTVVTVLPDRGERYLSVGA